MVYISLKDKAILSANRDEWASTIGLKWRCDLCVARVDGQYWREISSRDLPLVSRRKR